jgi:putative ABC transport system permease protein
MTAFKQAWRALVRRPAFTVLTLLTLSAGIAVVTTTFSIVDGVLLRDLPFPDAGQLVTVYEASPAHRERQSLVAPARLADWNGMTRTFEAISASYSQSLTDTSGAAPERLDGRCVLPKFFDVYRMPPLAGRTFVPDEERFGGSKAAVISEDVWMRRFGRSPSAIGARLLLGGTGYTIVGVMPRAFTTAATDIWIPAQLSPQLLRIREARFVGGIGRITPGISIEDARADLARVQAQLGAQYPATDKGWSVDVADLKTNRIGGYRRPLALVFGAVALLFLIAVANVAGLVLVQLHRRAPEFAVRAAIGGSRRQIVAAVMREIAILGGIGAMLGTLLSIWLTQLASRAFATIPRMDEVAVDVRALAFVLASTLIAAVLFGLLPAVFATGGRLSAVLSSVGRNASGGRHRLQSAIVVAQLALGVVLAGTAGLLVRSYGALTHVDAGFDATHVVTFHVGAAWDEDRARVGQLQERLIAGLRQIPGVRDAGYANFLPASGATLRTQITVEGLAAQGDSGVFTVGTRTVTPGYLRALSYPLVAGAWPPDVRVSSASPSIIPVLVNRRFVDRFAGGQMIVGRHLSIDQTPTVFQIAGVVGDVLEDNMAAGPVPYVYLMLPAGSWPDPEYVVRGEGDPRALGSAVRALVTSLDASRPLFGYRALSDVIASDLDQPRLDAEVITTFAGAALVLAALGLYGLLMLFVTQRRAELGVRVALGARPRDVVRLVVSGAGGLVLSGIGAGVMLSLAVGYAMRALLFGVTPYDPAAIGAAVIALGCAALVAIAVPARHAARVNPLDAMRSAR